MTPTKTIVFDLDDTLVNEIDYLKSAFREIAGFADASDQNLYDRMLELYRDKENVFGYIVDRYPRITIDDLKKIYRNHLPDFGVVDATLQLLTDLKNDGNRLGLVTDGFSVTQRNKLKALGIAHLFNLIIISEEFGSEKPDEANFRAFHSFETDEYWYIADNVAKDFITPNKLGWATVCLLNNGHNIHPQDFGKESVYLPAQKIDTLDGLRQLLKPQ